MKTIFQRIKKVGLILILLILLFVIYDPIEILAIDLGNFSAPDSPEIERLPDGSVDCKAYENYLGFEPAEVAAACQINVPKIQNSSGRSSTDLGYAQDIGFISDNFVSFTLNNFSGQTVIGTNTYSYYGMDFDPNAEVLWALNDTTDELGTINLSTGSFTGVVACPPGGGADNWTGLTIDPITGTFFASTATNLYTINPATGIAASVGAFGVDLMIDIAINANHEMYGHDIATDSIYSINISTGSATLIGGTGYDANYAQGMDFDNEDGTLYIFLYIGGGANVYGTVNLSTGAVTALSTSSPQGEFEGAIKTPGPLNIKIYLPLIHGKPYIMPDPPILDPIDNNGSSSFMVNWSASDGATNYILEEDDNQSFSSPTTIYTGPETSFSLNKTLGTYYYRVKASNLKYTSGWSNVVSAVVTIESPFDGTWTGSISGGNSITMLVINNGTEIDTLELYVNWGGACGVAGVRYYFYDISISGGHFYKSQGAGGTNVSGDFNSSTTASGDFFAYLDTGSCTASRSGTWTANYVP